MSSVSLRHNLVIGCGYLGRRVAQAWLAQGFIVSALTRSETTATEFADSGLRPIIGDICHQQTLAKLPGADTVLFAVGYDRSSGRSQSEVYVDGLRNVLDTIGTRIRRLIYVSSSSVYGQSSGEWVDESSECAPVQSGGQCCLKAEAITREYFGNQKVAGHASANILRLSGIYGPGRLLARAELIRSGAAIMGRGDAWLNLIHVDDAVEAILACEQRGSPGATYLVTDNCPIPRDEYYRLLATLLQAPMPRFNPEDTPQRGSGGQNKRCSNRRFLDELGVTLRYPTINEGLPHALLFQASPQPLRSGPAVE